MRVIPLCKSTGSGAARGWGGGAGTIMHFATIEILSHLSTAHGDNIRVRPGGERVAGENSTMEERNVRPVSRCPELWDTRLVRYHGPQRWRQGANMSNIQGGWECTLNSERCVSQSCCPARPNQREKDNLLQTCVCLAMCPAAPCPHLPSTGVEVNQVWGGRELF